MKFLSRLFGRTEAPKPPLHPEEIAEMEREAKLKIEIRSAVDRLMEDQAARYYAESTNYGHDFNTCDKRCAMCGLPRIEFDLAKSEQLWKRKAYCTGK